MRTGSENERTLRIVRELGTNVLDAPFPFRPKKVKPEAVLSGISFRQEASPKHDPLGSIHETLEDRVLHSLTVIFA
jgi:hypothetical protein